MNFYSQNQITKNVLDVFQIVMINFKKKKKLKINFDLFGGTEGCNDKKAGPVCDSDDVFHFLLFAFLINNDFFTRMIL